MTPQRVQRRRTAGWKMPEDAVYVGRPTRWGNPARAFKIVQSLRHDAPNQYVLVFREWLEGKENRVKRFGPPPTRQEIQTALRGKNLACWCPLDQPCHADVLLEIANSDDSLSDY